MVMMHFDNEEFLALSRALEKYHGIFYHFWNLGKPFFSEEIKTAAVYFDKLGNTLEFKINYDFWQKQTWTQKLFVICHECIHVLLNHGLRIANLPSSPAVFQAVDVVDNHLLIESFGFLREEVDPGNSYCWIDTVFPNQNVENNKSFEYYFNLLKDTQEQNSAQVMDDHQAFKGEDFENLLQEMVEKLSHGERQVLKNVFETVSPDKGEFSSNLFQILSIGCVEKKKKWETVIKKWSKKYIKEKNEEEWIRLNRRLKFFEGELLLPFDQELEEEKKDKIQVWFFQDTSGSCYSFMDRFFKAAKSLPEDRFDVKMHCFDTRVFETTLESQKLYGFGCTSFSCIEDYIQQYMKNHNVGYPRAIFLITDGMGNKVNPQIPERWYWFLSSNYKSCIPRNSNIYMLKDFE